MNVSTSMKQTLSFSLFFVFLSFLFACNSNKQVPNANKQTPATENTSGIEEKIIEAGDTTTQKTEFGTVKSLRTPEDVKAAEERKKAAEPEKRQERILEAGEMFANRYCNCNKGSQSEIKTCKDKVMEDVDSVASDTGMGLTPEEKALFRSTFDMRIKNCQ